jgi:hypothetical protein
MRGAVEVLDALNDDTKLFCPPTGATNLQRVQTIVNYIEARPERKNGDFRLVANEAMAKAYRAKNSLRREVPTNAAVLLFLDTLPQKARAVRLDRIRSVAAGSRDIRAGRLTSRPTDQWARATRFTPLSDSIELRLILYL